MMAEKQSPAPVATGSGAEVIAHTIANPSQSTAQVDPRVALLLRASIRWELLDRGELDLEEALSGLAEAVCSVCPRRGGRQ